MQRATLHAFCNRAAAAAWGQRLLTTFPSGSGDEKASFPAATHASTDFIGCVEATNELHTLLEGSLSSATGREYNDTARFLSRVGPMMQLVHEVLENEEQRAELQQMLTEEDDEIAQLAGEEIEEIEQQLSEARNGLYTCLKAPEEDWDCPSCGATGCYGTRQTCYMCNAPKPGTNGEGCRIFGGNEDFDRLCVAIHSQLHDSLRVRCHHQWVCLRDRVHNRADGRGKYMAYKCSRCGAFQRRYV